MMGELLMGAAIFAFVLAAIKCAQLAWWLSTPSGKRWWERNQERLKEKPRTLGAGVMAAFRDMGDAALLAEFEKWDYKVKSATGWGAALMQAAKWRDACGRILTERGLMRDFEPCIRRAPPSPQGQTKEGGR